MIEFSENEASVNPLVMRMRSELNLDEETIEVSRALLREFFSQSMETPTPETQYLLHASAILIASLLYSGQTVDGRQAHGNGITFSQVIKSLDEKVKIIDFLDKYHLFVKKVKIEQKRKEELLTLADDLRRRHEVFVKFEKTFQILKVNMKNNSPSKLYIENIKKVLWVIFLVARQLIPPYREEDILNLHLKSAPLLHAVFLIFSLNIPCKVQSEYLNEQLTKMEYKPSSQGSQNLSPRFNGEMDPEIQTEQKDSVGDSNQDLKIKNENLCGNTEVTEKSKIKESLSRKILKLLYSDSDLAQDQSISYFEQELFKLLSHTMVERRRKNSISGFDSPKEENTNYRGDGVNEQINLQQNVGKFHSLFQEHMILQHLNYFTRNYQGEVNEMCFLRGTIIPLTPFKTPSQMALNYEPPQSPMKLNSHNCTEKQLQRFLPNRCNRFINFEQQDNGNKDPHYSRPTSIRARLGFPQNEDIIGQKTPHQHPIGIKTPFSGSSTHNASVLQTPMQASLQKYSWLQQIQSAEQKGPLNEKLMLIGPDYQSTLDAQFRILVSEVFQRISPESSQKSQTPSRPSVIDSPLNPKSGFVSAAPPSPNDDGINSISNLADSSNLGEKQTPVLPNSQSDNYSFGGSFKGPVQKSFTSNIGSLGNNNSINHSYNNNQQIQNLMLFFWNVLDRMILNEERQANFDQETVAKNIIQLLKKEDFLRGLLAICIDTYTFIVDKQIDLQIIIQICRVNPIDFWRVISNFARFDQSLPSDLRQQIFDDQRYVLLYLGWEQSSLFPKILQNYFSDPEMCTIKLEKYEEILCKRIINHTALRVYEMATLLHLEEDALQKVWLSVEHLLFRQQEVLENRYLDQIIICAIYATYMAYKHTIFQRVSEIKFKTMIEKFEELSDFNPSKIKQVGSQTQTWTAGCSPLVKTNHFLANQPQDLISFYNSQFLQHIQPFFQQQSSSSSHNNSGSASGSNHPQPFSNQLTIPRMPGTPNQINKHTINETNSTISFQSPIKSGTKKSESESTPEFQDKDPLDDNQSTIQQEEEEEKKFTYTSTLNNQNNQNSSNFMIKPTNIRQNIPDTFIQFSPICQQGEPDRMILSGGTPMMTPHSRQLFAFGETMESPHRVYGSYLSQSYNQNRLGGNSNRRLEFDDSTSSQNSQKYMADKILGEDNSDRVLSEGLQNINSQGSIGKSFSVSSGGSQQQGISLFKNAFPTSGNSQNIISPFNLGPTSNSQPELGSLVEPLKLKRALSFGIDGPEFEVQGAPTGSADPRNIICKSLSDASLNNSNRKTENMFSSSSSKQNLFSISPDAQNNN